MKDEIHYPTSLGLKIPELLVVLVVGAAYIFLRITMIDEQPILVAIVGFVVALWAIIRPTEWAVEGLGMLAQRIGIGTYAAGVIGSIMANLPELVLAALLIVKGQQDVAILTVLVVAGANTLLFGVVTVRSARKQEDGTVKVPITTLRYESELMSIAFVAALAIFVFNFAEEIKQLAAGEVGLSRIGIPLFFSIGTVAIYVAYLYFLGTDKELNPPRTKEEISEIKSDPAMSSMNIIKFLFLGIIGILIAGELLANGAELLIHTAENSGVEFSEAYVALAVGLLGSLPEWAIAFRAEDDIELVFGSVLSSVSATILFMLGLVSIFMYFFVPGGFALDPFGLVQIVLSGSILLFVHFLMKDDGELDAFEGICIIIIQLVGFDILLSV